MRFDDVPREWLATIAVVALSYALAVAIRGWARRVRMRRRFARGAEGEREAVAILKSSGFVVEATQATGSYAIRVDAEVVAVGLRADYLVSRGRERFVAEVKTGKVAPRIDTTATRRQLLEYQHAFGVSGVLLVDADARSIQLVRFDLSRTRVESHWVPIVTVLVAAVVLLVLAVLASALA